MDNHPTWGLKSMSNQFRWLANDKNYWAKLRNYKESGNVKIAKMDAIKTIEQEVIKELQARIEKRHEIHWNDIARIGLYVNKNTLPGQELLPGFVASHHWVNNIRKAAGLSSRRITKFVTKVNLRNAEKIENKGKEFVQQVRQEVFCPFVLSEIANADQSGFIKEFTTARTMAPTGSKTVEVVTQSSTALTHSYTMMPTLLADGTLRGPLFVVLQEPGGAFPTTVPICRPTNMYIEAHSTHIMTKALLNVWIDKVFLPNASSESLLIVDSWPAFRDHQNFDNRAQLHGKEIKVMNIPAGCTGKVQPLDVHFFGPSKRIMKHIHAFVRNNDIAFSLSTRDNLIKVLSLVYDQLQAPAHDKFRAYSWHKAGYFDAHPESFEAPFDRLFKDICGACTDHACKEVSMIKCSYCDQEYCFSCFFEKFHGHHTTLQYF